MKKKILFWVLGIIGVLIIGGGIYAYNVYSSVSKTLEEVHKPLKRDQNNNKVGEKVNNGEPVSILLLGADERGEDKGRSDSLMVITLNPKNNSMKTVSILVIRIRRSLEKGKVIKSTMPMHLAE